MIKKNENKITSSLEEFKIDFIYLSINIYAENI